MRSISFVFTACGMLLLAAPRPGMADTITFGITAPFTGPSADRGKFEANGARLAIEGINKAGGVLGRQVELVTEDDQGTNPGAVMAFGRLSGNASVVAFLGPNLSTQIHAVAPDLMKAGRPMMIGGSDPKLTHLGNPWLFRCRPNDSYSARVIADFGVNTLGRRKWAIIHSTDAFGTSGKDSLIAALKAAGVDPVIVQGYPNNSQDFTPVVLAVKRSSADIIGSYVALDTDQGILARQMRQLGVTIDWIGSPTITNTAVLALAGSALNGTYGVADFHERANPVAEAFAEKYKAIYGIRADFLSAWTYDAVTVLARAITAAGSTAPDAIRSAILTVRGFEGVEGTYTFDQNGDGLHGYNLVHNDNGTWVFDRHIEFKE